MSIGTLTASSDSNVFNSAQEEGLVRGCVEGKRSSQELLYKLYAPKMFGLCLRYCNNYHTAEDVLQEGFIKVFQNIDRFKGEGSFEGWLKRIFINTAIEHYRKQIKVDIGDDRELQFKEQTNFNDGAFENLALQDMLEMMQKLSPGYRAVFNMFAIEGYSHKEIGEYLGISEGTSKSQLARARQMLQKMLLQNK